MLTQEFENYYKYGSHIPKSITGIKNYWKEKYLDLLAIIAEIGLPVLFLTFTANDSWPGLKIILSKYNNKSPILHPVYVAEYFFKGFFLLLKEIKNEVFFPGTGLNCKIKELFIFYYGLS
jgi:hypothetical protein